MNLSHKYVLSTKCVTDTLLVPENKEMNKRDRAPIIIELSVEEKIQRVMQEGPEERVSMVCSRHKDREDGGGWYWWGRRGPGQGGPLLCAKGIGHYSEGNCVNQNFFDYTWMKRDLNNLWSKRAIDWPGIQRRDENCTLTGPEMRLSWGWHSEIRSLNLARNFPASLTMLTSASRPTHFLQMIEKTDTYSFWFYCIALTTREELTFISPVPGHIPWGGSLWPIWVKCPPRVNQVCLEGEVHERTWKVP